MTPVVHRRIDGAFIRRARAEVVAREDLSGRELARRLADQVDGWFDALAGDMPASWTLIATGGYANGLLCPGSDIDVILLHPHKAEPNVVRDVAEPMWYPMWDAGLKLSPAAHSARSVLQLATTDLVTATTILSSRHVAGDDEQADELRTAARQQWQRRAGTRLLEVRDAVLARWEKTGSVASLLEPDLKEGQGGLRDYDAIRWALLAERPHVNAALEIPVDDLAASAELLLAVRCELHRVTGSATNVLLLQHQDAVAAAMGYTDADVLMARVAEAAHFIEWAGSRFWSRAERVLRRNGARPSRRASAVIQAGITVVDDEVEVDLDEAGVDQSLVLRVAAAAAHARYPISRRALLKLSASATDEAEPWHERTRHAMLSLLGSGSYLVPTVEALERYDLFSRFMPEWRHVRDLPQRNAFHIYTVDRHLLQTVVNATNGVRHMARPDLLLMGALLHDIGKGYPDDHTHVGVALTERMVPRMGFNVADAERIRGLVAQHLLLAETATRRDLRDPRTAENVASLVGDAEQLHMLHALTVADSKATGPSAWSAWKQSLVDDLVASVAASFDGRTVEPAHTDLAERYATLVHAALATQTLQVCRELAGDLELWTIVAPDEPGLVAKIAGAMAMTGGDVLGAEAWTTAEGIAVDQFTVASPAPDRPVNRFEHELRAVVHGTVDLGPRLAQRVRTYSRVHRRATAAAPPRLEVVISNAASAETTMVDVRAEDGIAVLYRLASCLTAHGLQVRSAKVATLGHEVVDVFYVQQDDGRGGWGQVAPARHAALAADLRASLTEI